jgi:enoyl-CoA hydratase
LKLVPHPFYHLPTRQGNPDGAALEGLGSAMIFTERDGGCTVLRLLRSQKANALTGAMLNDLCAAVSAADSKALILTGDGTVFSAGADLDEMKAGLGTSPAWEALSSAIASYPGLTIAALNGTLAGGAMGMALACDLRIAVPEARFFYPVMRLGYLPQPSDPSRLAALVGPSRARMILLAGQRIGADEALAWGLIDRIVAPEALMDSAMSLAADALGADQGHLHALKRMTKGDRP